MNVQADLLASIPSSNHTTLSSFLSRPLVIVLDRLADKPALTLPPSLPSPLPPPVQQRELTNIHRPTPSSLPPSLPPSVSRT